MLEIKRCDWAENSELERNYHDHEWGDLCMTSINSLKC